MKRFTDFLRACLLLILMHSAGFSAAHPLFGGFDATDDSLIIARTEISLLTCQPHNEVYSLYGHTAIRVYNPDTNTDYAINWGVFDSSQPYFVWHFILGQTNYTMAILPTDYFKQEYIHWGSGVYQQRIRLTNEEKLRLLHAIGQNYLPENRHYHYNYFFDNCTTRARDMIVNNLDGTVEYGTTHMQSKERSFRDLIHEKTGNDTWAAEGNDLLLGIGADRNTTHSERQFLPEILMNDFDTAQIILKNGSKVPLVDSAFWMVQPGNAIADIEADKGFILKPEKCAGILALFLLMMHLYGRKHPKKTFRIINRSIFLICGIVGLLLTVMLFSEHPTVQTNLQILIFNPLWLILYQPFWKWKYRMHATVTILLAFFIGNIFQDYAEGMNILALILLFIETNNYLPRHKN